MPSKNKHESALEDITEINQDAEDAWDEIYAEFGIKKINLSEATED